MYIYINKYVYVTITVIFMGNHGDMFESNGVCLMANWNIYSWRVPSETGPPALLCWQCCQ